MNFVTIHIYGEPLLWNIFHFVLQFVALLIKAIYINIYHIIYRTNIKQNTDKCNMFKMKFGIAVKRNNGAGAVAENIVTSQREKQKPASVRTPEARKQKKGLLFKDKGFPEKYEQLLKRHYVGAELGRQRGRKAFSPGGGEKKKFKTSKITLRICLFGNELLQKSYTYCFHLRLRCTLICFKEKGAKLKWLSCLKIFV